MLEVKITYLEMWQPPAYPRPELPEGVSVLLADRPTVNFYRFLYDGVGTKWRWVMRKEMNDSQLLELIHDPALAIHVLYHRGCPAGYSELRHGAQETKLEYFGLMPEYIGQGLGRFWLEWTVHQCWQPGVARVWVHTCTLDHPRALPLYKRVGFVPYNVESVWEEEVST